MILSDITKMLRVLGLCQRTASETLFTMIYIIGKQVPLLHEMGFFDFFKNATHSIGHFIDQEVHSIEHFAGNAVSSVAHVFSGAEHKVESSIVSVAKTAGKDIEKVYDHTIKPVYDHVLKPTANEIASVYSGGKKLVTTITHDTERLATGLANTSNYLPYIAAAGLLLYVYNSSR